MTYQELRDRLDSHRDWLAGLGIPIGAGSRFATLRNAIEFVDEAYRTGKVSELMDERTNPEAIWGLMEATELDAALSRLRPLNPPGLDETVRKTILGDGLWVRVPATPEHEGESAATRARNTGFELVVGAHLSRIDPHLAFAEPDVRSSLRDLELLAACKRPFSLKGLEARVGDGAAQVARHRSGPRELGVLAIAADRLVTSAPGTQVVVAPGAEEAKSFIDAHIMAVTMPTVLGRLDELGDRAVDVVVVQANVPAVVGEQGLKRLSQVTIAIRSCPKGIDEGEIVKELTECFSSL